MKTPATEPDISHECAATFDTRIRAPAGCALGGTMFFSAGGMTDGAPADRYRGETVAIEAKTGNDQNIKLDGTEHTCSSVVLTSSGLSLVATVVGLYVRDSATGELLWLSPLGFAPRQCANPIVASGRVFINPVNGMIYCFEPHPTESGSSTRIER